MLVTLNLLHVGNSKTLTGDEVRHQTLQNSACRYTTHQSFIPLNIYLLHASVALLRHGEQHAVKAFGVRVRHVGAESGRSAPRTSLYCMTSHRAESTAVQSGPRRDFPRDSVCARAVSNENMSGQIRGKGFALEGKKTPIW